MRGLSAQVCLFKTAVIIKLYLSLIFSPGSKVQLLTLEMISTTLYFESTEQAQSSNLASSCTLCLGLTRRHDSLHPSSSFLPPSLPYVSLHPLVEPLRHIWKRKLRPRSPIGSAMAGPGDAKDPKLVSADAK